MLDWRMPDTSGLDVVRELRRRGSAIPILMLTARDTANDRVTGLDEGADDYLVKPFDFDELLARIRALQRRSPALQAPRLAVGDLEYYPSTREVHIGSEQPTLTTTELSILELLMRRTPAVVQSTRDCAARVGRRGRHARLEHHRCPSRPATSQTRYRGRPHRDGARRGIQDRGVVNSPRERHRSQLAHAARVAVVATMLIAVLYVALTVVFDVIDSTHLVAEVDTHLSDRLADATHKGDLAARPGEVDDDLDIDAAPVELWRMGSTGHSVALSDGAPALPAEAWSRAGQPMTAKLGTSSFRLLAIRVPGGWLVAGRASRTPRT